jgi:hypothetical protein
MTHDPSKMIDIDYNHLNLPRQIDFGPQDNIQYAYTSTGTKLRKTVTTQKTTAASVTDYCGNFLPNLISKLAIANLRFSAVNADG